MTDKKQTVTLEIQLLMDSQSRSKVPVWSETGTRRPLDLKAILVLLLVHEESEAATLSSPKTTESWETRLYLFVKFTGDAYRWIVMEAKVKETQPRSWLLPKDFPARAPKPLMKVKESAPISKLRAIRLTWAGSSGSQNGSCKNTWEWN